MMETVYSELKVGNLFEVGRMFPLAVMLFFLSILKLDVKDSFGYNKEIERMGKTFPTI